MSQVSRNWPLDLYLLWCEWTGDHLSDDLFAIHAGRIIAEHCSPLSEPGLGEHLRAKGYADVPLDQQPTNLRQILANDRASETYRKESASLSEKQPTVEWVVNSLGELGVKIGDDFQFLYKGHSLRYEHATHSDAGDEREGEPMLWRHVGKREFGECCHPVNYKDPTLWGAVDVNDGEDWKLLPPSKNPEAV